MSQVELLRAAVAILNDADVPYMIVGSYASAFHGEPRMTQDIDVVIDPDAQSIELLVDLVDRDRFYLGDAVEAFRSRSMFNLIEPSSGWKVDFVVRKDRPFSRQEFDRRFPAQIAGVDVYLATAEDTMLAKLEWGASSGSERQTDDVVAIASANDLDVEYLKRWAPELGILAELESVLARLAVSAPRTVDGSVHAIRLFELLEQEAAPVPEGLWHELTGGPIDDRAFVDFMARGGGSAVYEVWAKVLSFGFTRFLSGEPSGADSVRFQWELLDENLRHLLPFASNDSGGRYFFNSRDGSIWYGNVETTQEDGHGGHIADSFAEFVDMIRVDDVDD